MLEAVLVLAAAVADAFRPHWALLTEIALLRPQLAVLQRSVARPRVARFDRIVLVALATVTPTWRNVLRIVQPETLLRWHRAGFKALWRWRSRTQPASRLATEAAALVRSMASSDLLWGRREDPRRTTQARRQGQQAHDPEVHAGGGPPDREGSAGPRFYETTPRRSGPATFCRPMTCSSARSSRSCSSSSPPARSCSQLPVAGLDDAAASQRDALRCRLALAGALVAAGSESAPRYQVIRRREHAHVGADLGEHSGHGRRVDARYLGHQRACVGHRPEQLGDARIEPFDRRVHLIDVREHLT